MVFLQSRYQQVLSWDARSRPCRHNINDAKTYHVILHVISVQIGGLEKLTFSSAWSTPVAIWFSVVSASYSDGSIWSSLRTGRGVLTLNFLTRTLRDDMVQG